MDSTDPPGTSSKQSPCPTVASHSTNGDGMSTSTDSPEPAPGPSGKQKGSTQVCEKCGDMFHNHSSAECKKQAGSQSFSDQPTTSSLGHSQALINLVNPDLSHGSSCSKSMSSSNSSSDASKTMTTSVWFGEPDQTCFSLGSFIISEETSSFTDSTSIDDLQKMVPDCSASVSGKKNKNHSSVVEIHASLGDSNSEVCIENIHSSSADHLNKPMNSSTIANCPDKQDSTSVADFSDRQDSSTAAVCSEKQDSGSSVICFRKEDSDSTADCSEKEDPSTSVTPCRLQVSEKGQPGLEDLPREVLLIIAHSLPTISLIAGAAAHLAFTDLLTDVQFLNRQTRQVLGFAPSEKDITYDAVPLPVAPLQNLWFQAYLHRAAPHMVGLINPGAVFYDLLCFKHLLDTWILQGVGYKYWMFQSDVLKGKQCPPIHFLQCKRLVTISKPMLNMLTKMALCHPEVLLLTINNFNTLTISGTPLSSLGNAWDLGVPSEFKVDSYLYDTCEVVSHPRGLSFASFFFTLDSQSFIAWCGKIDYSSFKWKETWGLCRFSRYASLSVIQELSDHFYSKFLEYVGEEYVSVHCKEAFMLRGLCRLIQQRKFLLPQLQDLLEMKALNIHRKISKTLPREEQEEMKIFLDGVHFVGSHKGLLFSESSHKKQAASKTLEVAVQRYLHRYLNQVIGRQVLELYQDPICHHVLCIFCANTRAVNSPPFGACMEQVGSQRIPLKIWPPHLMEYALLALPVLARLVCLDMELWRRTLLDQPLSDKVALFVRQQISSVHLDLNLDPCRPGVIARRVFVKK